MFVPPRARAEEARVLLVSSSGAADAGSAEPFPSVTAALEALAARQPRGSPASIRLSPGVYAERVVVPASLARDLVIEPVAGAAPGSVTLEHRTSSPYEATVENRMPASAGAATLRRLVVRHASPSVANNYAAFATPDSSLTLESCDVRSDTGSGVAAEGATLVLTDCAIHDCKTHGVAVYGDLLGELGRARLPAASSPTTAATACCCGRGRGVMSAGTPSRETGDLAWSWWTCGRARLCGTTS